MNEQFQSTLPRRERRDVCFSGCCADPFQSTLPRRERPQQRHAQTGLQPFQSTLPRRERQTVPVLREVRHISIHAPAKGATCDTMYAALHHTHFNPRSREGSDPDTGTDTFSTGISIHAPAKGATAAKGVHLVSRKISIHAPAKGATHEELDEIKDGEISIHAPAKGATSSISFSCWMVSFQSTLPRRERHGI